MNKKNIIIIILAILLCICISYIFFSNFNKPKSITDISFNNMKIGDIASSEMISSDNISLDSLEFIYKYKDIHFLIDESNKISALSFFTTIDSDNNTTKGFDDVKIKCNGTRLKTLDDFKKCFGDGTLSYDGDYSTITYAQNNLSLSLTIYNNNLINVILQKI